MTITGTLTLLHRLAAGWLLLATWTVLSCHTLIAADDDWGDRSNVSIGDEAFTEPIEKIDVACSESGIVWNVNVKRGDPVVAGDLLVELDTAVLEASRQLAIAKTRASAKLNAAKVEFEQKNTRFNKLVQLYQDQAGSPEEVDKARADMLISKQNVEAIGEEIEQQHLELKRIESQLEQRRVRSPIAGVVVDVRKKRGEFVSQNEPHVATVVRLDTLQVVFHLPTTESNNFKKGDQIKILMIESDQVAVGVVEYVAPITSADSGRVRLDVLIENPQGIFRSGVRCRMVEPITIAISERQPNLKKPFKN